MREGLQAYHGISQPGHHRVFTQVSEGSLRAGQVALARATGVEVGCFFVGDSVDGAPPVLCGCVPVCTLGPLCGK